MHAIKDSGITKSDRVSQRQGSIDFSPELMPGVAGPVNFFDPWLMTRNLDEKSLKLFREAELKHGRVCGRACRHGAHRGRATRGHSGGPRGSREGG